MRNRIVTAVKQRFSIRKLSIGAASVLLGTSLYFMGASAPVVHAATTGAPVVHAATTGAPVVHAATEKEKIDTNDPVVVAGDSTKNDADVNNAIDKYAQGKQEKLQGDHAPLIRPSDTQSVTVNTPGDRAYQVGKIRDKIDYDIKQANEQANKDKESIEKYKNDHPQTLSGQDSDFFKNQGLSVGDEKNSEINQISVDHKDITLSKGQSETIDGIDVIHTNIMTNKEQKDMKINSDNKVIIDLQHDQCKDKEITVTYDNLKNSYYLENIDDKINKIKISKIERTFSDIQPGKTIFTSDGKTPKGADGVYDECDGPQLIIYNDPSDGFFYNNITQVSVNDIYYDDKGSQINFDTKNDKNKAWIFVTSLNSNGNGGGNVEKVRAQLNNSPANAEKIKGSTVTNHNDGWWYSDKNNWFNKNPDWDNNDEDNRFGFVGTVAFQYQPGMTLQYWADDSQWGSHWASMQTQVVSSLDQRVIIYDHIKDGTENVTGNDDVNMTVHYVMDDGSKAPSDSKQTVNFTETGVKDKVTGKIAWTPADSQTLNDVPSPVLTGYTADIKTAKGKAVNFGDPDINVTVHYSANAQTAKITYIDDTTKKNLYSQAANGKFGQTITFETAPTDDIASYKKQGYVLVSNSFNNQTYAADNSNNVFYVHLKHKTENVTRNDTVTRTIHYLYDNGNTAQPDKTQTVSFNETGTKDYVTGETTWSNDNAQSVDSVNTPSIVGYTPDKSSIEKQSFKFGDQDVEVTVTYHANAQIAKITYIDDTTKKNLYSQAANGKFGQTITFETAPTDDIASYKKQGYVLVSNSFNNQTYAADNSNNVFYVHLKHKTENVTRNDTVTRTIHYLYDNGNTAQPDKTQTVSFNETGTKDYVTGETTWSNDNAQSVDSVNTPSIVGYTPDKSSIEKQSFKFGDQDVEVTVTYHANAQIAKITYIDDTTKNNLDSQAAIGKFGQAITFATAPAAEIENYKKKGYVFVSNNFDNQTYQAVDSNNVFEVHFKHGTTPVDPEHPGAGYSATDLEKTITRTINYLDGEGKSVALAHTDNCNFTARGTVDKVTGKLVSVDKQGNITGAGQLTWNAETHKFDSVDSPKVAGMHVTNVTPDNQKDGRNVKAVTVTKDSSDIVVNVYYAPNGTHQKNAKTVPSTQTVKIVDNQGKELRPSIVDSFTFSRTPDVTDAEGKTTKGQWNATEYTYRTVDAPVIPGYVAEKPSAGGKNVTIDNPNAVDQIIYHKIGKIVPVTPDGKPIPKAPQPEYPNDPQDPTNVKPDEPIPNVPGYTPVDPSPVTPKDPTKPTHVTYTKDPVAAAGSIDYIDDTTGSHIESASFAGNVGTKINYTTAGSIKKWEAKGYDLVSNNFKDGDEVFTKGENTFEVHFKHGTTTVTPDNPGDPNEPINPNDPDPKSPKYPEGTTKNDLTKDSTQTIIYHYSDGSKPDEKKTETHEDTFTRTKVVDKVTGEVITTTPWTGSHTFDSKDVPVVNGYHSDKKTVGGKTATVNDPDVTDTVTYTPNGKIIPVDPSGNPIPNVPNPTYPTDPNDPTKVVPNEPVPDVPGRTPEVSTVTPEDPSQDTPVVYNPIPNVPGPSVGPSDNTPTPVTPTPGKTTEEKKPDENKDDKDVDEPDDDEDVVPTPRHHKKHNGGESSTTRPRPKGYTPAPRGSSYLDANGKVHYKLPQTGESDSEEMAAVLGGAAATIGLIGLAGAKKRRHE